MRLNKGVKTHYIRKVTVSELGFKALIHLIISKYDPVVKYFSKKCQNVITKYVLSYVLQMQLLWQNRGFYYIKRMSFRDFIFASFGKVFNYRVII